jgi:hypothetical protein
MRSTIFESSVLSAVAPLALHSYLSAQGWQKVAEFGNKGDVYSLGTAPEIVAPSSLIFADYPNIISQILSILSSVENRSEIAVLKDLLVSEVDLIRVRAPSAEDDGSISIEAGVELIQQSRDLLLAAACSATQPKRVYRAGRNQQATEYLNGVRIGQTEIGSFVVTLLSPVPPSLAENPQVDLWPSLASEPFQRKVTRRLVDALRAASEAVSLANRGMGITVFEERVDSGISANLCDATAKLIQDGDGLDVSVSWALTRLTPDRRVEVKFKRADSEILREAAKVLRDREARFGEKIYGYVTNLSRNKDAIEGRVTIKTEIDGVMSSVRADFESEQYRKIVEAHEQRKVVTLEGDLQRDGQRWKLTNTRDIQILLDEDDQENGVVNE